MMRWVTVCLVLLGVVVLTVGCVSVGGQSTAPRYYVLRSALRESKITSADTLTAGPVIGIRRIEISRHLDRPQIVTRRGENEVHIAEFDRWAEPLDAAIPRVIAENLSVFVPSDRVVVFPWKSTLEVDYEIDLGILEFSLEPDGNVALLARWDVLDKTEGRRSATFFSTLMRPTSAQVYDTIVEAMSGVLEDLSREIAGKIRSTP